MVGKVCLMSCGPGVPIPDAIMQVQSLIDKRTSEASCRMADEIEELKQQVRKVLMGAPVEWLGGRGSPSCSVQVGR